MSRCFLDKNAESQFFLKDFFRIFSGKTLYFRSPCCIIPGDSFFRTGHLQAALNMNQEIQGTLLSLSIAIPLAVIFGFFLWNLREVGRLSKLPELFWRL